jgi:N-acetylmuramic acid 6-phosphate etherase
MVDLSASNLKLKQRSRNILRHLSLPCAAMTDAALDELLASCHGSVKLALMVSRSGLSVEESRDQLDAVGGVLAKAFTELQLSAQNELYARQNPQNTSRRLVLCVDAGGSKCRAIVRDYYDAIGKGFAGPCSM